MLMKMPCVWKGNRGSGVALTTRQTLVVYHVRAQGLKEGDEHFPYALSWNMVNFIPYLPKRRRTIGNRLLRFLTYDMSTLEIYLRIYLLYFCVVFI